jgi:toxin FitB
LAWFSSVEWNDLHLSAITAAELWRGIAKMPNGRRRRELEMSFQMLPVRFEDRILPVNFSVAVEYGEIQARSGPLPVLDALIAATAITHHLRVITRNTRDFAHTGAAILNPWS